MKYLKCPICGQIVSVIKDTEVPMMCCGVEMEEITPITKEEHLEEKHIPVYKLDHDKVITRIGSIPHPMSKEHYIEWITLVTNKGNHHKNLKPGDLPRAEFRLGKDEFIKEIYAYCNIHQLWLLKVNDD